MDKKARHVVPRLNGSWAVRQTGAKRASRVFSTQADAITYATSIAKREMTSLFVHRRDGTVERKNDYAPELQSAHV